MLRKPNKYSAIKPLWQEELKKINIYSNIRNRQ